MLLPVTCLVLTQRTTCVLRRRYVPEGASVLIIKPEWSSLIFAGCKTLEIRSFATKHRGTTHVCESGSRFLCGQFDLWDCEGPLTEARWEQLRQYHLVPGSRSYGASTFAWSLRSVTRLRYRVPCARTTQVIFVRYASACNARWFAM